VAGGKTFAAESCGAGANARQAEPAGRRLPIHPRELGERVAPVAERAQADGF
jgi:hypothetical protein